MESLGPLQHCTPNAVLQHSEGVRDRTVSTTATCTFPMRPRSRSRQGRLDRDQRCICIRLRLYLRGGSRSCCSPWWLQPTRQKRRSPALPAIRGRPPHLTYQRRRGECPSFSRVLPRRRDCLPQPLRGPVRRDSTACKAARRPIRSRIRPSLSRNVFVLNPAFPCSLEMLSYQHEPSAVWIHRAIVESFPDERVRHDP